jgi:hypothetical protein
MSAGGCREVLARPDDRDTFVAAVASSEKVQRVAALWRQLPAPGAGRLAWVRGTNSNSYVGGHLLTPDKPAEWFQGDLLMRFVLGGLDYRVSVGKRDAAQRNPVLAISRHAGGFFLSGYMPNTNVELRLRFPQGAPLMTGMETLLAGGQACYRLPRAWHKECRVFVDQPEGELSCVEKTSEEIGIKRRLLVTGLKDATVRFYPEPEPNRPRVTLQPNPKSPFIEGPFLEYATRDDALGRYLQAEHLTGSLLISW